MTLRIRAENVEKSANTKINAFPKHDQNHGDTFIRDARGDSTQPFRIFLPATSSLTLPIPEKKKSKTSPKLLFHFRLQNYKRARENNRWSM